MYTCTACTPCMHHECMYASINTNIETHTCIWHACAQHTHRHTHTHTHTHTIHTHHTHTPYTHTHTHTHTPVCLGPTIPCKVLSKRDGSKKRKGCYHWGMFITHLDKHKTHIHAYTGSYTTHRLLFGRKLQKWVQKKIEGISPAPQLESWHWQLRRGKTLNALWTPQSQTHQSPVHHNTQRSNPNSGSSSSVVDMVPLQCL